MNGAEKPKEKKSINGKHRLPEVQRKKNKKKRTQQDNRERTYEPNTEKKVQ